VLRSTGAKYGKPYIKIHNQVKKIKKELKKEKIYKKTLFSFLWTRSYSK
jgi:hypothetical protein